MLFEINIPGKTLTIEAVDAVAAVKPIQALLGLTTGDELMLDLNDWRGHDWFDGRSVYTPIEIIENDLECTSTDVYFNHYADISNIVASGAWFIKNGRAYCLPRLPRVRKRLMRGDFAKARATMALIKLRQLIKLSNEFSLKKRG